MFRQENKNKSYYDILKINPDSSDSEVKKAYLELVNIYHPDKNPGNKKIAALKFRLINEAYEAIKTSGDRARYNRVQIMKQQNASYARINLKADNDNKSSSNDSRLWHSFIDFFTATKSANPKKQNSER